VAGWGRPFGDTCLTDSYGPSTLKACKVPYTYNDSPFYGCTYSDSPAAMHPICRTFSQGDEKFVSPKFFFLPKYSILSKVTCV
jgi:hypothetical protein